jgi:hypothetical protein
MNFGMLMVMVAVGIPLLAGLFVLLSPLAEQIQEQKRQDKKRFGD